MTTNRHLGSVRSEVRNELALAGSALDHEISLLSAIAREIRSPGDDVASRLPAAGKRLSINRQAARTQERCITEIDSPANELSSIVR